MIRIVCFQQEKSVGALKKAIKEEKKRRLHDIDADSLNLWKVSEPIKHGVRR